jgi:lipopolysaccharide/colanic/teichoic acid biosynthesis glycosyltransferase
MDLCEQSHDAPIRLRQLAKRTLDVALSIVAIIALAPVFLAIALVVKATSPGPVMFRQNRVGKHGKQFNCLKFRTMVHNAGDEIHRSAIQRLWVGEVLSGDPEARYKLAQDQRVTLVGRWLRRCSLDELPQLINVLRGEMSIVGPRPALPYEVGYFRDLQQERQKVRPGITGLAQIKGRGCMPPHELLKLDLEYVRAWSVRYDLKIIGLTLPVLLSARGAR